MRGWEILLPALLPFKLWTDISASKTCEERIALLCRHIGHKPFEASCWIQVRRQCYTGLYVSQSYIASRSKLSAPYEKSVRTSQSLRPISVFPPSCIDTSEAYSRKLQSSPGYLHVGQVPSNWTRQMPHTSSSGMSQRHEATAFHFLMVTFIFFIWWVRIWRIAYPRYLRLFGVSILEQFENSVITLVDDQVRILYNTY